GLTLWGRGSGASLEAHGGHEAVDVTGAGDAVVATASLALAAGAPALEAAALANGAGSGAGGRRGAGGGEGGGARGGPRAGRAPRAGQKRARRAPVGEAKR